jgi:hypothetical protein
MCGVTVNVLRGSVILGDGICWNQTVWWTGITDKKVMEGRERKRASQVI